MPKIISTSGSTVNFSGFEEICGGEDGKTALKWVKNRQVTVKGRANVIQRNKITGLLTVSESEETVVSDEDLEFLKSHKLFKKIMADGFYEIVGDKEKLEKNKVAKAGLKKKDKSAQYTTEDLKTIKGVPTETQNIGDDPRGIIKIGKMSVGLEKNPGAPL